MSRFRTAAIGAAVVLGMAGVAGAQQTQVQKDSTGRWNGRHGQMGQRGMRAMRGGKGMRGDHGKLMADLKLTDAQKNQIKAIHAKYEPQFKALRDQGKAQFGSMREARQKGDTSTAARARFKQEREAFRTRSMAIRQQEQNEVRAILTADQRAKFDAAQAQRKAKMEERMKRMNDRGAQLKKSGKA